MKSPLTRTLDRFFGRGEYGVTVPAMDGALRPNDALDSAALMHRHQEVDNVTSCGGRLYFSSRSTLFTLSQGDQEAIKVKDFGSLITAVTSSASGTLAVALAKGDIVCIDPADNVTTLVSPRKSGLNCITAMTFEDGRTLLVCNGSSDFDCERWVHDLMTQGRTGSVWKLDCEADVITPITQGLAWPGGIIHQGGSTFVSESWRHRVVEIGKGEQKAVLADLPGYPSRIVATKDGALLCVFAPRSQLIEFVLRERSYCDRMIKEVPPAFWVAPALFSGRSYLEPLQGGSVKQLGILKPWAPTRSYGLLVELDAAFQPVRSHHSRADGNNHGVTSVTVHDGAVLLTSRGAEALLQL